MYHGRGNWRRGMDSNPRYLAVNRISSAARSTPLPPLRNKGRERRPRRGKRKPKLGRFSDVLVLCPQFPPVGRQVVWEEKIIEHQLPAARGTVEQDRPEDGAGDGQPHCPASVEHAAIPEQGDGRQAADERDAIVQ